MTSNLLAQESSPYLLQHKDNPVHWMGWGDKALALAATENKPILLSVGYAACHWCHVMAHESFENPEIADIMNDLFINIKVDREERPDLDSIYQNAISLLGQQGGWPLTVFLTPNGTPFWGGTYFPPSPKWGRPGFPDILQGVSNAFHEKPEDIEKNARPLMDGIKQLSNPKKGSIATTEQLDKIATYLVNQVDFDHGGVGGAPKFPQPMILKQLRNAKLRTGDEIYSEAIKVTLNGLCQGGIYDHLGGGFSRYSVDERWLAPHFEKMLYDNAQLITLLTSIWQGTGEELYRTRVFETIEWVIRDLYIDEGAFTSSYDADSEGVEGKFYIWDETEIDELLKTEAPFFKSTYDISKHGNWEGHNIINLLNKSDSLTEAEEMRLKANRDLLLKTRNQRIWPARDDKILADWNGLIIKALVKAGEVFDQPQWIEFAKKCYDFICLEMIKDSNLYHSWCNGKIGATGILEDYANMMDAALSLYEISGDEEYLEQVENWAKCLDENFRDTNDGAFFTTDQNNLDLIANQKTASDNAVPAGNGTLLGVYTKLYLITGKDIYQTRAEEIIHNFSGEIDRNFYPLSTFLNNTEFFLKPLQIIIVGEGGEAEALRKSVNKVDLAEHLCLTIADPSNLARNHPARMKTTINGKAAAYICEGPVCSIPLTNASDVLDCLQKK